MTSLLMLTKITPWHYTSLPRSIWASCTTHWNKWKAAFLLQHTGRNLSKHRSKYDRFLSNFYCLPQLHMK